MVRRLKLYDTNLLLCINHKEKEKIRKIAYKQKMTMSQYLRHLIQSAILLNEMDILENQKHLSYSELQKIVFMLGGFDNENK